MEAISFITNKVETEFASSSKLANQQGFDDIQGAKSKINWSVKLELRSWGVENISINISSIETNYVGVKEKEPYDSYSDIDILYTESKGYDLIVSKPSKMFPLYPTLVTIDEFSKQVLISFD